MGKKILLADDSITIQKVIELTFSDEDFEVVTVGNGRLAIERVSDVRPDVVLCDIIMPEKDGYEVCDFIKKNPALSHIPVLLLTGAFEPFDQEKAARVGCDGFLAKPFYPQTLIAKVKDLLAKGGGSRTGATGGMRSAPAAAPTPAAPAPPSPPPAAVPAPPFSSTPAWSAPPPPASTAPPPFRHPEPEPEPEPIEEEPEEFPTMVSRPGAHSETSAFDAYERGAGSTAPPELTPMTPEESATLGGAGRDEQDDPATAVYQPGRAPWSQQTIEVPLEMRAQAGVSAQSEPEPLFEEVFDEEPAPPPPPAARSGSSAATPSRADAAEDPEEVLEPLDEEPPAWSAPQPPARPAPQPPAWSAPQPTPPPWSAPQPTSSPAAGSPWSSPPSPPAPASSAPSTPASTPPASSMSFADVTPAAADSGSKAPASEAAEVSVTPDMVEKIAQRVVAQISEKVVREVAWEVIPDLAEALIKKEIERLKAELQRS